MSQTDETIAELRETHRMHQQLLRACVRLDLQIKAIERRVTGPTMRNTPTIEGLSADQRRGRETDRGAYSFVAELATIPLQDARESIRVHERKLRRRIAKLGAALPVYPFASTVPGLGAFSLAQLVAEAGDLSAYRSPPALWKRMGLAVIDGSAQKRVAGAAAHAQGYSPIRRSIMYVIGESLIKKQNQYRQLYLERKIIEAGKAPELTKMHLHLRAHRYMEKRLLRDLWRQWPRAA